MRLAEGWAVGRPGNVTPSAYPSVTASDTAASADPARRTPRREGLRRTRLSSSPISTPGVGTVLGPPLRWVVHVVIPPPLRVIVDPCALHSNQPKDLDRPACPSSTCAAGNHHKARKLHSRRPQHRPIASSTGCRNRSRADPGTSHTAWRRHPAGCGRSGNGGRCSRREFQCPGCRDCPLIRTNCRCTSSWRRRSVLRPRHQHRSRGRRSTPNRIR